MFGIVSFLNDMSSEMISLIVLSYFIDVFGEGKFISGLIMGVIESMSFFF